MGIDLDRINDKRRLDKEYIELMFNEFINNSSLRISIINILKEKIDNWNDNHFLIFRCLVNDMTTDEIMDIFLTNKNKILYYYSDDMFFKSALINRLDCSLVSSLIKNFIELFDIFDDELIYKLEDNKFVLDYILDSDIYKSVYCIKLRERISKLSNKYLLVALICLSHGIKTDYNDFSNEQFLNIINEDFKDVVDNIINKAYINQEYYDSYLKPFLFNNNVSKEFLLYKCSNLNKTILEVIISKDSKENIKKIIIDNKLENDFEIVLILKLNGIDINSEIKFDPFEIDMSNIEKEKYSKYLNGELSKEENDLINELRNIFMLDGNSDIEVIDLACNSFRYLFLIKNEFAMRDLQSLINIKLKNNQFKLIKGNSTYFSILGFISIKNCNSIGSFNHELTHALHFYIKNYEIPLQFSSLKIKINQENYDKFISIYRSKIEVKKRKILDSNHDFYMENKGENDLKPYVTYFNEIINSSEKDNTCSKEVIDYVKTHFIIEEEYHKYYNNFYAHSLALHSMDKFYSSIIDIVDALCSGDVYESGITLDNYKYYIGHGSNYYKDVSNRFLEIFAQYVTIIKSQYRDLALIYLEGIVGRDLIEILDEFYNNLEYKLGESKKVL